MDLVQPEVDRYLAGLAATSDPVLREMEDVAARRGFPIVGPQVGRLLHVLAAASGARRVLELGSGFGYSAIWLARALGADGLVVLTEASAENAHEAAGYLARAGLQKRARIEVGDALEIASRESGPFDLVFNDIDKEEYPRVAGVAARLLRPGGLLVSDNMLWYGRVLRTGPEDDETRGVRELTRRLYAPEPFFTTLVPLRDGVTVSVRS